MFLLSLTLGCIHRWKHLGLERSWPSEQRGKPGSKKPNKKCKQAVDVKNVRDTLQLQMTKINTELCRPLRKHCGVFKFCSELHRKQCAEKNAPTKRCGGREAMDEKQVVKLFEVLSRLAPWAAVLMLLQLFFKNPDGDC